MRRGRETLLGSSGVLLFGRVLEDLMLNTQAYQPGRQSPRREGANNFLIAQLSDNDAKLARIYGFSYSGDYYQLDEPSIFLVHGGGVPPEHAPAVPSTDQEDARLAQGPAESSYVGSAVPGATFASDIRVWSYDQADFTVRLDVSTGMFEELLLDAELGWETEHPEFSGGKVGGGKVGGGKVGGGKVGGGKVGGGKVGGGKVGGGKVGGGKVGGGKVGGG